MLLNKTKTLDEGNFLKDSIYSLLFQCLKESYVKALGVGIGFEVQRLNFTLSNRLCSDDNVISTTKLAVDNQSMEEWRFEEFLLDNHCIAVAIESTIVSKTS